MIPAPFILLPLIVALPLAGLLKNEKSIAYVSVGASLISLAMLPFINKGLLQINWFSVGPFQFSLVTNVSTLNYILLFLVLLLSPFIYIYSIGYFKNRVEYKRYYLEMLSFTTAMAFFSIAGNFISLFVAWEFLSIASYLLIGFWYRKKSASRAARKALTIVFIGDIALLASIAIIWNTYGTLTFANIISIPKVASLLLLIAIFTKSAQFPFNEWLPDAMEGPVPVSAYLHSTTMVKAGVFIAILLFPLFERSNVLLYFIIFGIITALIATLNALKETHVKRILAYSTVQELGLMLSAVGIGAIGAAVYFFFAQAFYKALLFFSSGIMIEANENENINSIYGLKRNRLVYISTLFGVLALAGFIPFDGFFSSVSIGSSFSSNLVAYIIISLISVGTSFFIFRWLFTVSKDTKNKNISLSYITQPKSMVFTTFSLSVLLLLASVAFFYFGSLGYTLSLKYKEAVIETALVALGFAISYIIYVKEKISISNRLLESLVYNSRFFNLLYEWSAKFVYFISNGAGMLDLYINDMFDWLGHATILIGNFARRIENGGISFYALVIILSFIAMSALVLFA
jgi:NADH-quinone oxidoreductase subunit L